jgi:hypothetical protein
VKIFQENVKEEKGEVAKQVSSSQDFVLFDESKHEIFCIHVKFVHFIFDIAHFCWSTRCFRSSKDYTWTKGHGMSSI